jgi:pilus assembly protein CpaE
MSNILRFVLADPAEASRQNLKSLLLSMDEVWLEADCSYYDFFPDIVTQAQPDVAVLVLDSDPAKAISLIERLSQEQPECALLVASASSDGHLILRALRAGAREFLTLPVSHEELQDVLQRVRHQKFGTTDSKRIAGEIIAVCGATGGVGCTSIATNLACLWAEQPEHSVALVDLDLALGDADVLLNLLPDYTLADVVENTSRLDIELLKKSLAKHASGLHLLARPVELRDLATIHEDAIRQVLGLLRASFSHVVVDLSKAYSAVDSAALQLASRVLLVTQLDLPCLRNTVRLLMSFEEVEGLSEKVELIVNRIGLDAGQISLKKAKETLGRELFATLPNDGRTLTAVRNNGVPLQVQAPKAPVTAAVRDLASRLSADREASPGSSGAGQGSSAQRWSRFWPGANKVKT